MTVSAQIKFVQGALVGVAGQALEGVAGTPVVVSNGTPAGVTSSTFTVIDAPPASAITPGIKQGPGATPTWTFTPDHTDSYLIQLTVTDGTTTATDIREFRVRRATARVIPAFMGNSQSENYSGQTRGWAPTMEDWLNYLDSLLPALHGVLAVAHSNSPQTLDQTHQIAKVDTTVGGTIQVNAPATGGAIVAGWQIAVIDDTQLAGTNPITVSGNGHNIENPALPGTFAASVNLAVNSAAVVWMFDGAVWKVLSAYGFSSGTSGGGGGLSGVITVTHAATGVLDQTHQIAKVQSTSGTTQVNAPAIGGPVGLGWQILVFDDTNDAAANNLTVSGNGVNIEDPNTPGIFAATVALTTSSCACGWMYDGAQWKLIPSLYALSLAGTLITGQLAWARGGREQGEIHVTNGTSPGTLTPTVQLAFMESATGATAVNMPAAPTADLRVMVTDADGLAAASPITVHPNGHNVENPNAPGTFTGADIIIQSAGATVVWVWDATATHWKIVSAFGFLQGTNVPGAIITTVATLLPTDTFRMFGQGALVRFPAAPIINSEVVLKHAQGTISSVPATFDGNGHNIEDPQDPLNLSGTHPTGATVTATEDGATFRYRFDGTIWRCTS